MFDGNGFRHRHRGVNVYLPAVENATKPRKLEIREVLILVDLYRVFKILVIIRNYSYVIHIDKRLFNGTLVPRYEDRLHMRPFSESSAYLHDYSLRVQRMSSSSPYDLKLSGNDFIESKSISHLILSTNGAYVQYPVTGSYALLTGSSTDSLQQRFPSSSL